MNAGILSSAAPTSHSGRDWQPAPTKRAAKRAKKTIFDDGDPNRRSLDPHGIWPSPLDRTPMTLSEILEEAEVAARLVREARRYCEKRGVPPPLRAVELRALLRLADVGAGLLYGDGGAEF
jgi:hypothetical protein